MDSQSIFFAFVILDAGLFFWLIDRLGEIRRANASEASMIRVILGSAIPQRNPYDTSIRLRDRRRQVLRDRS
jgi:hypothetical protein